MTNVNTTINALPPAVGSLTGSEIVPLDQGGVTKKATVNQLISGATIYNFPTAIEFVIDGGNAAITSPIVKGYLTVPFGCNLTSVTLLANQTGSILMDIWKCTEAQFDAGITAPTSANSITASTPPQIINGTKYQDVQLTSWTKTLSTGDVLGFYVQSATTVQKVTLSLTATRILSS